MRATDTYFHEKLRVYDNRIQAAIKLMFHIIKTVPAGKSKGPPAVSDANTDISPAVAVLTSEFDHIKPQIISITKSVENVKEATKDLFLRNTAFQNSLAGLQQTFTNFVNQENAGRSNLVQTINRISRDFYAFRNQLYLRSHNNTSTL